MTGISKMLARTPFAHSTFGGLLPRQGVQTRLTRQSRSSAARYGLPPQGQVLSQYRTVPLQPVLVELQPVTPIAHTKA